MEDVKYHLALIKKEIELNFPEVKCKFTSSVHNNKIKFTAKIIGGKGFFNPTNTEIDAEYSHRWEIKGIDHCKFSMASDLWVGDNLQGGVYIASEMDSEENATISFETDMEITNVNDLDVFVTTTLEYLKIMYSMELVKFRGIVPDFKLAADSIKDLSLAFAKREKSVELDTTSGIHSLESVVGLWSKAQPMYDMLVVKDGYIKATSTRTKDANSFAPKENHSLSVLA